MAENNVDISQVTIEVGAEASAAGKNIDSLASALSRLNSNSKLTRIINNLDKLSTTLQKFQGLNASANALTKISVAVGKLSGLQKLTGLNSALNTLKKFPDVVSGLDPARLTAFSNAVAPLSEAVGALGDVQKLSGLNSVLNTLKKIPDVTAGLKKTDLDDFAEQILRVRTAVAPLASEMEKVSKGFSALPANIQKAIAANQKLTSSNKTTADSYNVLGLSISKTQLNFTAITLAMRELAQFLGGALTNFNAYVENVNLFTVSMGRFAEVGRDAVQTMQDVLGVDMSEAMRNMGVLQNLTTSFGVLDSQAYILSKNLTQLGYDMVSFFNIDTASAFEKLQAAISGELEPIRRLGVDISEARLQQELYNLGIDASVKSLSQADKALLRYIAIMDQTSNAQTDMARTLNSPANMIRVFQAQVTLLVRSIGSLLIPMLNALLPPLIAVTQVLREAITAIASFIGIDVDFASTSTNVAGSVGDISSDLDNVTESAGAAADAISYLIGGFDELNVLPSAGSGSGSGASAGGASGSILDGISLPEYDMYAGLIASKVKKIVDQIKKLGQAVKQFIRPVLPIIEGLAAAFLTMFAVKKFSDFISLIKEFAGTSNLIGAVASALLSFDTAFGAGEGVVKSVGYALKDFRSSLSLTAKIMIGAGGFVAAFVTSFSAIKDWTLGVISGQEAAANIAAAVAIVGTALTVALGPIGLAITAVGALTGAIVGNAVAINQQNQEIMENNLMNGTGIPVEALVKDVEAFNDSVLLSSKAIQDNTAQFEQNQQAISDSGDKILSLSGFMNVVSGDIADQYVPEISSAFDDMYTSITSNMELIRLSLIGALSNTPQDIINQLDADVPYLTDLILESTGNITEGAEELRAKFEEVYAQWQQNPSDELRLELMDLATQMYGLTDEGGKALDVFNTKIEDIGNVDLGSSAQAKQAIDDISTSAQNTIQTIEDTRGQMQSMLDEISAGMSAEDRVTLQKFFDDSFTLQEQQVLSKMESAISQIRTAYEDVAIKSAEEAKPTWLDSSQGLTEALWLGLDVDDTIKANTTYRVKNDLVNAFDSAISEATSPVYELANTLGLNVAQGYSQSITSNTGLVTKSASDMVTQGLDAAAKAQDSHSPSRKYMTLGQYVDQGYANGVTQNVNVPVQAVQNMSDKVSNAFQQGLGISGGQSTKFRQYGTQSMQSLADGYNSSAYQAQNAIISLGNNLVSEMDSIMSRMHSAASGEVVISVVTEYSSRGSASAYSPYAYTGYSTYSIPALADGGVLTGPQLVMAGEYSGAATNPEIVTPQNIMRETMVDANEEMAVAIVTAIQALQRAVEEKDQNVYITESDVGRAAAHYGQQQRRRTGKNPFATA